ncbi:hypothetical protein P5673_027118 [Acropora cervicornis]|uniref:Uncharacterized protein n=1 Tax=Acropora cervicornis TaxID=6130 RepID=A0AAD9PZB5_ACRCE|nr:hypothetical protein P5673_027118 [Acropora cervicornis]
MESQLIESEFEMQNEGNAEITLESFEANIDSQIEMQMRGEQQIGSLQTSSDVEGEQFVGYEGSTVTQETQNVQILEMSAEGTMQLSGQEIYYDGGFISKAAIGCGEGQELETTMQGMEAIEAQSGGIMKQEMQLKMNGQVTEMKAISMEGGVMASHEMRRASK